MKVKRILALILSTAMILPLLSLYSLAAWTAEETENNNLYGSRFSTNSDDWFAEGAFVDTGVYVMPDINNTGYVTAYEDLEDFGAKYPLVPFSASANGSKIYTITEDVARRYNYIFTGFKIEHGGISVKNTSSEIVIRDFFIDAKMTSTAISNARPNNLADDRYDGIGDDNTGTVIGRVIILDGEMTGSSHAQLTGYNLTVRRCYMHHCQADHIKGFTGQIMVGNYLCDGGLNGGTPHPDGIQYSSDDGHGKPLHTVNVFLYGNRIDVAKTSINVTNACIMFKSEFGGGFRNVYFCKNWFSGGGVSLNFATGSGGYNFLENVCANDNLFGRGEQWIDKNFYFNGDTFLENNIKRSGNKTIDRLQVGSITYTVDGKEIHDFSDCGDTLSVKATVANYTLEKQPALVQATVFDADGKVVSTDIQTRNIVAYTPYNSYKDNADFRYTMLPCNEEISLTLSDLPSSLEGCYIVTDVYMVRDNNALEKLREDVLTRNGNAYGTFAVPVPTGYLSYDPNVNSPSNLFKNAVNDCAGLSGESLYDALNAALRYYAEADDSVGGVAEAKSAFNEHIERYNTSLSTENAQLEAGLSVLHEQTELNDFWRDPFEAFYILIRCLFIQL